ncbi:MULTISPECIES: hypothetical protein [Methylobacterium]|uniref:hypothetical protein n=1 Tax=Methylobacterium TaxID=407 RepID=UPI0013ED6959|nr:hypothetical protein [Methylobacterium sp. DB0501]NGM38673.1 hypothetical protein [Methylobacterium sp. DB0501]
MAVHLRVVAIGLSLGLGGCFGIGQSREPHTLAPAWAAYPSAVDAAYPNAVDSAPDKLPESTCKTLLTSRNSVDPLCVLSNSSISYRKPQNIREPRQRFASISPAAAVPTLGSAALPLALENAPSILAKVAVMQEIHKRNSAKAREKERADEKQIKRITASICSGC